MSNNPPDTLEQVRQLCRKEIETLDEHRVSAIDAKVVASSVARVLDKDKKSPALIFLSAIEGIAQMARAELRRRHGFPEPPDPGMETRQIDAFAKELSPRYSVKRKGWRAPKYVLREDISTAEVDNQVIPMLESYCSGFHKHIDLCRAWNDSRKPESPLPQ